MKKENGSDAKDCVVHLLLPEVKVTPQDKKFLDEFLAVVEKNLADPDFNIDALCKKMLVSRSTLFRKMSELTGEGPHEFIQSYRLKRAAQLLRENYGNVTEVSLAVGFFDQFHFSKCFKKKFLKSPKEYQLDHLHKPAGEFNINKRLNEAKAISPIALLDQELGARYTQVKQTSLEKVVDLEKAVFKLFHLLLETSEPDNKFTISYARQQDKFVCETTGNSKLRFLIECKNYSSKITKDDIAGKLLAAEAYHRNIPIDHWILVSPNANVSNELEELIELWEETGKYPFKVQAWTPATRVKEFFGLIPEIHDSIITEPDHKIHPKDWNEEKRQEVIKFWKEKLEPPLRLPKGWEDYLRNPEKFLCQGESRELENIYYYHLPLNCLDETGAQIYGKTLEDKVMEWLEKPIKDHPTLLLLGDYGDGKTVFSYILSRKLAEQFLKSPSTGWLPVRFSLKDFNIQNVNTSREFLRRRLEEIGTDIEGWRTLAEGKYKLLAILDGFDEMSKKMDQRTILNNINQMVECYRHEFSGMKVLITSRKHFFENQQYKERLINHIGSPQLLAVAPISRKETEAYLRNYARSIGEEEKLNKLMNLHDPIGLASTPLFLEMVKNSLKYLPKINLDEVILYETYIRKSLERKGYFLEDENLDTSYETIFENMKAILEIVAVKLHQEDVEFIYLSDIHGSPKWLKHLWGISNPEYRLHDDEMGCIAVRSLLRRIMTGKEDESKQWPVDFCHRSMREYFVARAVCKMVEKELLEAKQFLRTCYLSPEIIFFSSKIMRKAVFDYTENLQQLILESKYNNENEKLKVGYLGINAENLLSQYKGIINQPEVSTTEFENDSIVMHLADELRNAVETGEDAKVQDLLKQIKKISPEREEQLKMEFGFIDEDEKKRKQKEGQIEWRRKVWKILSVLNNFESDSLDAIEIPETNKDIEKEEKGKKELEIPVGEAAKRIQMPERKGEELEQAVFELFKNFFNNCEEEKKFMPLAARQQDRGRQSGFDLKFIIGASEDRPMRIVIECKNYSKKLVLGNIADKLMAAKIYHKRTAPIDHWILVSPNTHVSNELHDFMEIWEEEGEFPFKVQAWTKDENVQEFFGLIPEIYDRIVTNIDRNTHPKEWTEEYKKTVLTSWKEKLTPPLRIPKGWAEYLRDSKKLLLQNEFEELENIYESHLTMHCTDETGTEIHGKTLEDKVMEWLEKPIKDSQTLLLLGDFGDGKTVFAYILSRKLVEQFKKSPSTGWIPIRFFLKDLSLINEGISRKFLSLRLEEIGVNIDDWNTLSKRKYRLLAIFDGFDEMSQEMDHENIMKNAEKLVECYNNDFSGVKLLITSRKHILKNQQNKEVLLKKIKDPQLLMLAPIKRKEVEQHLRNYAKKIGQEEKLNILLKSHDPIGLGSKPLYLKMIKATLLKKLPEELDELFLYENYIQESLESQAHLLRNKNSGTAPDDTIIIENMKEILETLSIRIHQADENKKNVYLSDIKGTDELRRGLWKFSNIEECECDDEKTRIANRSLLVRVAAKQNEEGKQWPVDFCHRSMREYFVARAICKMVEQNPDLAKQFLRSCCLSYEIIFFSSKMMKKNTGFDYTENLWQLIQETKYLKDKEKLKVGYLGSNAANLLFQYKGTIPKEDWSDLVLDLVDFSGADLSGKNFSHTSFHYAKLDNVNFTNANFTGCDFTGVKLEEASPVRAVAVSRHENIYALYDDGIIREWKHDRVRIAPHSINLGKMETANDIRLIAHPGNDLTLVANNQLKFYDKEISDTDDAKISPRARIDIKPLLKPINATNETLLLSEEKGNWYNLQLINLENQSIIQSVSVKAFTLCADVGNKGFIIYDRNDGLQAAVPGFEIPKTIIQPDTANITCLATWPLKKSDGQWRLAFGQENGTVTIIDIDLSTWEPIEVVKYPGHEKAVRYITFINESQIVSGGIDRKILLTKLDGNEIDKSASTEFKLHLQCKGMKIDGIHPEETMQVLQKLIATASSME